MSLLSLSDECFNNILIFLDVQSLYNCLFVNRYWCRQSVPILWRDPFNCSYRKELISTLLSHLVNDEISLLNSCAINFNNQHNLFNYGKYVRIINNDNCVRSIKTWLKSLNKENDCITQKLINVVYHTIMRQGSNLQELKINVCQLEFYNDLPKFSSLITHKPGITNLRSLKIDMNPSDNMEKYQNTIEFLSMVSKFCSGIVNCNLWIHKLSNVFVKPLLDIIKLQPLEKLLLYGDVKRIIFASEFRSKTLKELNFGYMNFLEIDLSIISKLECLEQLRFASCKGFILKHCEGLSKKKFQLKELLLFYDNHDYIIGMELNAIVAMINSLCSKTLFKLTLNVVTPETVGAVEKSCPNLNFLSIRIYSNQFLNSTIPLICELSSLKTLRIDAFDEASAGLIVEILGDYMTSVEYLLLEFQIDLQCFKYFTNNCKANLKKLSILEILKENSWKNYLACVNNYQKVHNSLKVLGSGAYNVKINNLTNEELKIIKLLKNQGVDIVSTNKVVDIPERFLRPGILAEYKLTEEEINLATDTITKSIADYHAILISTQLSNAIKNTLTLFSQEFLEVPYIWTYKKDLITKDAKTTILSRADLWRIFDHEYEFRKFIKLRDTLKTQILQDSYASKVLSEAKNIEELSDLSIYVDFIHQKFNNAKYLEYIHKGLHRIVEKFGVNIPLCMQNIYLETRRYQPTNDDLAPRQIIAQFYSKSENPELLLKQSIELFALEISADPIFRKFVRNNYIQHGLLITSGPLEAVSNNNECWSYCFWKIKVQKAFNIGSEIAQILHYKNQNLIDISFQLCNEEKVIEILKNNIVNYNPIPTSSSHIQWNEFRINAILQAYNNILKPSIESELITKLKVNAEQWIMEQCMLNLERKIDIKPMFRIFALTLKNIICCVYINESGIKFREWSWSMLNPKEGNGFLDALSKHNPNIIVLGYCDIKTKHLLANIKKTVCHYNRNRSEKAIVTIVDEKLTSIIGEDCENLAKIIQNPLLGYFKLGYKIMDINFHPLQSLLSKRKLMSALDRAFINVANEVGVDINGILNDDKDSKKILKYICGFGAQESNQFYSSIFEKNNLEFKINSRSILKNYLSPKVYQNSIGFLKVCPNPINLLDNTRIHPDFYDLVDMDNTCPNQEYFLTQLINNENSDPFADRRQVYDIPTLDQIFEMVTKETEDSLHPDLIVSVVVKNITAGALKVHLRKNPGFECNIGQDYIDKESYDNIKEGDILDALVKSINKEDFTIILSCKQMDLENGHHKSFYNKRFDEFVNEEAKQNYKPVNMQLPHTITHPHFYRISAQEAEKKLFKQKIGSYIIRPTADPDKLSVTWKIYHNIYRHFHIIGVQSEPEFEVGHKLFVENEKEEYTSLTELVSLYVEKTNYFINKIIHYEPFRPTTILLNEYLEASLARDPKIPAIGFYMDNANPGYFFCGFKFWPGTRILKMRIMFKPYGFYANDVCYNNFEDFIMGIGVKVYKNLHCYNKAIIM